MNTAAPSIRSPLQLLCSAQGLTKSRLLYERPDGRLIEVNRTHRPGERATEITEVYPSIVRDNRLWLMREFAIEVARERERAKLKSQRAADRRREAELAAARRRLAKAEALAQRTDERITRRVPAEPEPRVLGCMWMRPAPIEPETTD